MYEGLWDTIYYIIVVVIFVFFSFPKMASTQSLDEALQLNEQVIQLYKEGKYSDAISFSEQILKILENSIDPEGTDIAIALINSAILYKTIGDKKKAIEYFRFALNIFEKNKDAQYFYIPKKTALLVGIDNYKYLHNLPKQGMCNLKGASNDVQAVKKVLIYIYNFSEAHIKILLDEDATYSATKKAFYDLINKTHPGDLFFFYFSGHGVKVKDHNKDEKKDEYDEGLFMYDADLGTGKNIIIDDELERLISKLSGRRIYIMIDSCYSGGMIESVTEETWEFEYILGRLNEFIQRVTYRIQPIVKSFRKKPDSFWPSTREDEVALESKFHGNIHGVITKIWVDVQDDHKSYKELIDEHQKMAQKMGSSQSPVIIVNKNILSTPVFNIPTQQVTSPEVIGDQIFVVLKKVLRSKTEEMKKPGIILIDIKKPIIYSSDENNFFFYGLINEEKRRDGDYPWLIYNFSDWEW